MVTEEAQRAIGLARSIVLMDAEDNYGLSNQDKWSLCQSTLEEVRQQGFFVPLDWVQAYDWEVGNRLLSYAFMAQLRAIVFMEMLKNASNKEDEMRFDYHMHASQNAFLRLKDKYEAITKGKTTWEHKWLN